MSIDKDNLPLADGQEKHKQAPESTPDSQSNDSPKVEETETNPAQELDSPELTAEDTTGEAPVQIHGHSPEEELSAELEKLPQEGLPNVENNSTEEKDENSSEVEEIAEKKPVENTKDFDDTADHDQAHNDEETSEEEDENETVPIKDYEEMSLADLVKEAKNLISNFSPLLLREAFGGLRDAFRKKASEIEATAKEKFLEEGGNVIDFRHENPHGTSFFDIYAEFRSKVDAHYKAQEAQQEKNLKEREAIINELKALYTEPSENNAQIFKKFRDLKTRWHNAGRIPKAQAANLFKTYYFHLDNFNEFLDLNQELRKMDYEHNLEVRHSIIDRAKALLKEDNVQKALNELQYLHRMWKEEGVPVAEEMREPTWLEFKELTNKIHDRKTELNEQLQKKQLDNLAKKNEVIRKIGSLIEGDLPKSHNAWQKKIKEMKALRDEFFALGRVPREHNQPTWEAFKEASKVFNHEKNSFYKNMKSEQMDNLEKKRKLVEIANQHKDSTDWNNSVQVVKRIQSEWKKIGHVPRKFSDKIWKEFSAANNHFFDRYKNRNNERLEKQQENLDKKLALLEEMKSAEKPNDKNDLLVWINEYSVKWSTIGYVPNGKQDINKEFTSLSEKILEAAGLDKNAIDKAQWDSQLDRIKTTLDEEALRNLKYDTRKQIDDVQKDVTHLQTNLAFFSNADENNPLFKNAIQNIENKVNELKALESKYDDLKHINLEAIAAAQGAEAEEEKRKAEEAAAKKAEEDALKATQAEAESQEDATEEINTSEKSTSDEEE